MAIKVRRGKNSSCNPCPVDRGVGVHRPNDDLDLRVHPGTLGGIGSHERESTHTLPIQPHVLKWCILLERLEKSNCLTYLCKGLCKGDLVTLLNEMTDCKRILGSRTRCETLVCHVEEGEELLVLCEYYIIRNCALKASRHTFTMSDISFHWSGVGSIPVGLWAHACRSTILFSGAAYITMSETSCHAGVILPLIVFIPSGRPSVLQNQGQQCLCQSNGTLGPRVQSLGR